MTADIIEIRPLLESDRAQWEQLYQGYAAFYKVAQTAEMRQTVWSWIMDPLKEVHALAAANADGKLIGLAHFRPYARPLSATTGGFLDDLFVDPNARGSGAAAALINAVRDEAAKRGWSVLRWTTAEDNYRVRGLYDHVA